MKSKKRSAKRVARRKTTAFIFLFDGNTDDLPDAIGKAFKQLLAEHGVTDEHLDMVITRILAEGANAIPGVTASVVGGPRAAKSKAKPN